MNPDLNFATLTLPVIEPTLAVTVALPSAIGSTIPVELTLRISGFEVVHPTVAVRSCVLPSVNTPVAVRPEDVPRARLKFAGPTVIEVSTAALTVKLADPDTPLSEAETLVAPVATPVNCPAVPSVLLIFANRGLVTLQCAEAVTSCVLPSLNDAVAVKLAS